MAEKEVSIPVKKSEDHTVTLKPEGDSAAMGAVSRLYEGELPTNQQISTGLDHAINIVSQGEPGSKHGEAIQSDIQQVLTDVKTITEEKNKDEVAQKAFHHAKEAAKEEGGVAMSQAKSEEERKRLRDAKHQLSSMSIALRRLARSLIWDAELRQAGLDMMDIFEGVFIQTRTEQRELKKGTTGGSVVPEQEGVGGVTERPTAATRKGTFLGGKSTGEHIAETTGPRPTTRTSVPMGQRFSELTKERKEELRHNLKRMLARLGAHNDFKVAVEDMFLLFGYLNTSLARHQTEAKGSGVGTHMNQCWLETKTLIERFARKPLDPLVDHTRQTAKTIRNDEQVTQYFRDLKAVMLKYVRNPELLEREGTKADEELDDIIDRGRALMNNEDYRNQTRWLMDESRDILIRIRDDPDVTKFHNDLTKLAQDLLLNQQGRPSPEVLKDSLVQLRLMLLPVLSREMQDIPFPRIEGSTKKYNYAVSNLRFSAKDLMPERLKMVFNTALDISTSTLAAPSANTRLDLFIEDINSYMEDVRFKVNKVGGMFKYEDWGTVNLDMRGARLHSKWTIDDKSNGGTWGFYVDRTRVNINKLRVTIKEAKHSVLDKLATTLFAGALRSRVETNLSQNLHQNLVSLTRQLNTAIREQYAKRQGATKGESAGREGEIGFGGPWPGWKNLVKEQKEEVKSKVEPKGVEGGESKVESKLGSKFESKGTETPIREEFQASGSQA